MRVLVIDDNEMNRKLLCLLLVQEGHEVGEAGDGAAGLELLRVGSFDAVITDILMPEMDGYRFCFEARQEPALRDIPILVHSAMYTTDFDEGVAISVGADRFLRKPATAEAVLSSLTEMAGRASRARRSPVRLPGMNALKRYSEGLVRKLAARNLELEEATAEQKRAQESVGKLLRAVEQAENMIFMVDPSGRINYVNPAFEKTYGFSKAEAVGATPRILKSGKHDDAFYTELWRALLSGDGFRGEIVNRTRAGRLVTVETSARQVFDADGKTMGFIAVQHDVSERRRLEVQIQQTQKMESIGRLAGGVAHDFNNLLTAILGYAGLLEGREPLSAAAREDLGEIRGAAERAAGLTRQLLAFSRKQVLAPSVVRTNELVAGIERLLRRLIGADVSLLAQYDAAAGNIRVDAGQVEQVILNLAVNARDAMPDGGTLTIETANVVLDAAYAEHHSAVSPGRYVLITVSDTGSGMDDETLHHIFEPFFTTKESSKGTGLGLATAYGIVKQSGGYIFAYSEPGRGSTFKLYFPLVSDGPAERPAAAPEREREFPRGDETILLAEGEPAVRSLAAVVLEARGYRILAAADGDAALAQAAGFDGTIDLLLTEVVMPNMSGPELAARLRVRNPKLCVLYMSGYTDHAVVPNGLLAGEQLFLPKPFTPRSLAEKVREALDRSPCAPRPGDRE